MKLTQETLRQTADAMDAYAIGKPVQYQVVAGEWLDADIPPSQWTFALNLGYRPKPEPKTRPWSKPDDVPGPVCWIRHIDRTHECAAIEVLVVCISDVGFEYFMNGPRFVSFSDAGKIAMFEWTTDRRTYGPTAWHKCEVTEG